MDPIRGAIQRPVTVSMFVIAVMLFGIVSLQRLPLNLLPDISYPSITVQTDYEDSAPEEVENLITRPVEEAVGVIPGLTRLSSVSRAGQSEVILEFAWGANMDLAALETREKLDLVTLPRDARRPVILRFDPSNDPILRIQLSGGAMSLSRLRYIADHDLRKSLESAEGVAAIKVAGGHEEQIHIEIDAKRLGEYNIPISEVVQALAQENLNQASGSLYSDNANYLVRIVNQFRNVEEIEKIIIRDQRGRRVVLGDVATVWRGAKERGAIARVNGKESVELAIHKEGDANTVRVADAVQARLNALKRDNKFPQGVDYQIVFNQAEFIRQSVDDVQSSAVLGGVLATLVLFVFLRDLRSTLVIALTIPIAIMATFALMYQTGITLNLMSLGGVALGVGMLVDNAIVVLESVHRHKTAGMPIGEAVHRGAKEVGKAVTASTLTTVAVFVPLIFVEGISGQLFRDQALTITYSLMASLAVALTLIPMALALRMSPPETEEDASSSPEPAVLPSRISAIQAKARGVIRFIFVDFVAVLLTDLRRVLGIAGRAGNAVLAPILNPVQRIFEHLHRTYPRALTWSLDHKGAVFGITLGMAAVAVGMALSIGAELIPPVSQGEFFFEVVLPQGTPLPQTDALFRELEKEAARYPGVKTVFSSIGGSNRNQFARQLVQENEGQIYVVMANKQDKGAEAHAIERLRNRLHSVPEAFFAFQRPTFFSIKTPVEVEIFAFDLDRLRESADKVAKVMETTPGMSDIKTSTQLGNPEVQIRFDREKLARLGLDEGRVASVVRSKIRGDVASRFREEDRQIEILVRADKDDRNSIENLRGLIVNSGNPAQNGRPVDARAVDAGRPDSAETASGRQPQQRTGDPQQPQNSPQNAGLSQNQQQQRLAPVRLGAIADIHVARGPSEVRRIRSQRAAVVSGNLTGRDLGSVTADIRAALDRLRGDLPPDVVVAIGGQNEEMMASQRSLKLALALAIFLVYLVMASQFESLLHPFVILFSIPLGLIGVVFALYLTNTTFSVMVFLGVIILAGIVVNNAIVLIDFANQLREGGMNVRDSLVAAGTTRLRPILMTTLTTVLGLIPMASGWGEGAEIRAPMAITVIGGLTLSTALTLIFIPITYELAAGRRVRRAATVSSPQLTARQLDMPHAGD